MHSLKHCCIFSAIAKELIGSFSTLAVQKFSSNVVEKCLELSDSSVQNAVIDELMNPDRLPRHIQDPYANYVVSFQKTILHLQPLMHFFCLDSKGFKRRQ